MITIVGKNGQYSGTYQSVVDAIELVKSAIRMCEFWKTRKVFLKSLKESEEDKKNYFNAFSLIELLYGLNNEEVKCYRYLKKKLGD